MRDLLLYILQNLLIIDFIILLLWLIDKKNHWKSGHLWRKWLWLFICLRMLFPMEIKLQDLNENWQSIQIELEVEVERTTDSSRQQTFSEPIKGVRIYAPVTSDLKTLNEAPDSKNTTKVELTKSFADIFKEYWTIILALIWAVGFGAALFYHALQYYLVKDFYFEEAALCKDEKILKLLNETGKKHYIKYHPKLLQKEEATTPMTFGYFKRKLVFPPDIYSEEELSTVLEHELIHIKFFDSWYKTLILIICDLYWFNPVFLLMKRMAYEDVEYVCDEYVTRKMSVEEKQIYGQAILKTVTAKSEKIIPSMVRFAVNKRGLKKRLSNLFEAKNRYLGIVPLTLSLMLIAACTTGISFSLKKVPVIAEEKLAIVTPDMRDAVIGTYYTDSLENIQKQKDIESSYITDRFTGWNHYYIDDAGTLWGTGGNEMWQLGIIKESDRNNSETQYMEPIKIAENVIHVDANVNSQFVIWLTSEGDLYGLGANLCGVLRMPILPNEYLNPWKNLASEPQLLMKNVAFASAGQSCISVLTKDGNVWWWGEMYATTGTVDSGKIYSEEPLLMLEDARYVVCDGHTAAAIDINNNLWLWGCNVWGQCGRDGMDYISEPYMACSDVEMVWVDLLSSKQNVYDEAQWWGMNPYSLTTAENIVDYTYTTFVRKTDGNMYACGIDLGHNVKKVSLYGDIYIDDAENPEDYIRNYSAYFLQVSVEEIQTREPKWTL